MSGSTDANKRVVEQMFETLYSKDWDKLASFFTADAHYEDVPTPDPGADGPANIVRRLRIGLEPVERFEHDFHRIVAEGDVVVLEHTETWHFHTGEVVRLPFVTVNEIEDGRIRSWRDYWDLNTLMHAAPAWWIEHLAKFSAEDFASD